MADLPEALDTALRARYRMPDVKLSVSHRGGLKARMNALERLHTHKGDRKGQGATRAAQSAGISPRAWRDWKSGKVRMPALRSQRKLEGAYVRQVQLPAFRKALKDKKVPGAVQVTATIKWSYASAKQYNRNAHRTTTLTGMRPAIAATIRAWAMAGPDAAADAFQRGAADAYSVGDDDGRPGIEFEGDQVEVDFQ